MISEIVEEELKRLTEYMLLFDEEGYLVIDYAGLGNWGFISLLNVKVDEDISTAFASFGGCIKAVDKHSYYSRCRVFSYTNINGNFRRFSVDSKDNVAILDCTPLPSRGYDVLPVEISERVKEYLLMLVKLKV
jgi:hypothetical protein